MATHVYRSFAVKEARDSGWTAFGTRLDKDNVWKAHYERGDNPADAFAQAYPDYFTHGEVSWVGGRTDDEDPHRIGLLVSKVQPADIPASVGMIEIDRVYARVFLTPFGVDVQMLVEPEDGSRWDIFTPKVEGAAAAKPQVAKPSGDREKPAPAPAPKPAASAPAPHKLRSDGDSPVKRVWAIADSMPEAGRKEVVAACIAAGINKNTAGTQYFHWKKAKSAST